MEEISSEIEKGRRKKKITKEEKHVRGGRKGRKEKDS